MKIIIIENDFNKKHKLWKLLCLNHGSIDMNFIYGKIDGTLLVTETEDRTDDDKATKEPFEGITITLKERMDAHRLEQVLEYLLEFEDTPEGDDDDI